MIENFALIIGAMKCGTTSLFHYLAQHPEICPSRVKEPNFFADDDNWAKGSQWYQSLWNWNPAKHKVALEASTFYTKMPLRPSAAARIATMRGRFRFIYVLRDPIERIESHYAHGEIFDVPLRPLAEGVDPHTIDLSRYAMQIADYYERFPRESILLLHFDDLRRDALSAVKQVCTFLDINPQYPFRGMGEVHNPGRAKRIDGSLYEFLSRQPLLRALVRRLPLQPREALRRLLSRKAVGNIRLTPRQREYVLRELRDDLRRLSVEYGFDVSGWTTEL